MKPFKFTVPQDIVFGAGKMSELPDLLAKCGSKNVLIISGRILEKLGVVKKVSDTCFAQGISVAAFLDVEPNPSTLTVNAAVEAYKANDCTAIVALGGGSPMDVAKAAGVLAMYGGSITEYEGADKVPGEIVPIIAIPTTAGTGSEVTAFAVITDQDRDYKLTVFSYKLLPRYALLDSELIRSLPPFVAASTGVDAFIHAMEAYLSKDASPFSDAVGKEAMELIGGNIREFVADRSNAEAADAMMCGAMLAGIAFAWARLGNIHAMSHSVSAFYNVAHGIANSVLMPAVLEFNAEADTGNRYEDIYNWLKPYSTPASEKFEKAMLVQVVRDLLKEFGLPGCLCEVKQIMDAGGSIDKNIDQMATDAMKSGNVLTNPRATCKEDIIELYKIAMTALE